jgi:hypothetical protein
MYSDLLRHYEITFLQLGIIIIYILHSDSILNADLL